MYTLRNWIESQRFSDYMKITFTYKLFSNAILLVFLICFTFCILFVFYVLYARCVFNLPQLHFFPIISIFSLYFYGFTFAIFLLICVNLIMLLCYFLSFFYVVNVCYLVAIIYCLFFIVLYVFNINHLLQDTLLRNFLFLKLVIYL